MRNHKWVVTGVIVACTLLLALPVGANEDPCETTPNLVLCGGQSGQGDESQDADAEDTHGPPAPGDLPPPVPERSASGTQSTDTGKAQQPTVGRQERGAPTALQDDDDVSMQNHPPRQGEQYLGNNTCRYWGTSYADGDFANDANFGVDDSLGEYSRASAVSNLFLPDAKRSWAWARGGVKVFLPQDWPQPSSISITYPWHTRGLLDVNADRGDDTWAEAHHRTELQSWRGGERVALNTPVNRNLRTDFGPKTLGVSADGTRTHGPFISPGNITYYGLAANVSDAQTASAILRSAKAVAQFFAADAHVWLDHEDWKFTLPDGWEIKSC